VENGRARDREEELTVKPATESDHARARRHLGHRQGELAGEEMPELVAQKTEGRVVGGRLRGRSMADGRPGNYLLGPPRDRGLTSSASRGRTPADIPAIYQLSASVSESAMGSTADAHRFATDAGFQLYLVTYRRKM